MKSLPALTTAGALFIFSSAAWCTERVYYFHNDHLGTPQALTDAAGRTVWKAQYDPFGKATVNEDPDGDGQSVVNNLRFPGQYYDAETGLHYNYHRYYDPATGRYLQPDPIGLAGGLNPYHYVRNNPIRFTDRLGLQVFDPGPSPVDPYPEGRDPRTPWLPPNLHPRDEDCPPYFQVGGGLIPLNSVEREEKQCILTIKCNYSGLVTDKQHWESHENEASYYSHVHVITKRKEGCCDSQ